MIKLLDFNLSPIDKFKLEYSFYSEVWKSINPKIETEILISKKDIESIMHSNPSHFYFDSRFLIPEQDLLKITKRAYTGFANILIFNNKQLIGGLWRSNYSKNIKAQFAVFKNSYQINSIFLDGLSKSIRSRAKNNIVVDKDLITKSSKDIEKIKAEFSFLTGVKDRQFYTPVQNLQIGKNIASYDMPKIVPGDISSSFLEDDFAFFNKTNLLEFLANYFNSTIQKSNLNNPWTVERITEHIRNRVTESYNFFQNNEGEEKINKEILLLLSDLRETFDQQIQFGMFDFISKSPVAQMHGDLCLSNILYCKVSQRFVLIDPKGEERMPVIYDLAKLSHSILGNYDFILADQYEIVLDKVHYVLKFPEINSNFINLLPSLLSCIDIDISMQDIRKLEAMLFLTMIPFHFDNPHRCLAFLLQSKKIIGIS